MEKTENRVPAKSVLVQGGVKKKDPTIAELAERTEQLAKFMSEMFGKVNQVTHDNQLAHKYIEMLEGRVQQAEQDRQQCISTLFKIVKYIGGGEVRISKADYELREPFDGVNRSLDVATNEVVFVASVPPKPQEMPQDDVAKAQVDGEQLELFPEGGEQNG